MTTASPSLVPVPLVGVFSFGMVISIGAKEGWKDMVLEVVTVVQAMIRRKEGRRGEAGGVARQRCRVQKRDAVMRMRPTRSYPNLNPLQVNFWLDFKTP